MQEFLRHRGKLPGRACWAGCLPLSLPEKAQDVSTQGRAEALDGTPARCSLPGSVGDVCPLMPSFLPRGLLKLSTASISTTLLSAPLGGEGWIVCFLCPRWIRPKFNGPMYLLSFPGWPCSKNSSEAKEIKIPASEAKMDRLFPDTLCVCVCVCVKGVSTCEFISAIVRNSSAHSTALFPCCFHAKWMSCPAPAASVVKKKK